MKEIFSDYPIVLTQDVIWGDIDAFQHLNNTVYFRFFEDARMAYFTKLGVIEWMEKTGFGPILASTSANFKAPLTYPDTVSIGAKISELHNKKFQMQYAVYSHTQKKLAAEGEGLIVYYDYKEQKSCQVPNEIVKRINTLEKI